MANIKFSETTKRALNKYIKSNFPDVVEIDDATRTGVALALWAEKSKAVKLDKYQVALDRMAAKRGRERGQTPARKTGSGTYRYYDVNSRHERLIPKYKAFVGQLSMVRVRLPQTKGKDFHTKIGSVLQRDHLVRTVKEFKSLFNKPPYNKAVRVDLVTPPRELGTRFGAISVYLGYLKDKKLPTFYVLEAGTATGDAKVPYACEFGPKHKIVEFSDYKPTPFADKKNIYVGTLTRDKDSPKVMTMTSRREGEKPYINVKATFRETEAPLNRLPGALIVEAALIVETRKPGVMKTIKKKA